MKIAFIGDLHGNYVATQALEKELRRLQVDEIYFLGDAVGKGPQSRETCDWVRANCTRFASVCRSSVTMNSGGTTANSRLRDTSGGLWRSLRRRARSAGSGTGR